MKQTEALHTQQEQEISLNSSFWDARHHFATGGRMNGISDSLIRVTLGHAGRLNRAFPALYKSLLPNSILETLEQQSRRNADASNLFSQEFAEHQGKLHNIVTWLHQQTQSNHFIDTALDKYFLLNIEPQLRHQIHNSDKCTARITELKTRIKSQFRHFQKTGLKTLRDDFDNLDDQASPYFDKRISNSFKDHLLHAFNELCTVLDVLRPFTAEPPQDLAATLTWLQATPARKVLIGLLLRLKAKPGCEEAIARLEAIIDEGEQQKRKCTEAGGDTDSINTATRAIDKSTTVHYFACLNRSLENFPLNIDLKMLALLASIAPPLKESKYVEAYLQELRKTRPGVLKNIFGEHGFYYRRHEVSKFTDLCESMIRDAELLIDAVPFQQRAEYLRQLRACKRLIEKIKSDLEGTHDEFDWALEHFGKLIRNLHGIQHITDNIERTLFHCTNGTIEVSPKSILYFASCLPLPRDILINESMHTAERLESAEVYYQLAVKLEDIISKPQQHFFEPVRITPEETWPMIDKLYRSAHTLGYKEKPGVKKLNYLKKTFRPNVKQAEWRLIALALQNCLEAYTAKRPKHRHDIVERLQTTLQDLERSRDTAYAKSTKLLQIILQQYLEIHHSRSGKRSTLAHGLYRILENTFGLYTKSERDALHHCYVEVPGEPTRSDACLAFIKQNFTQTRDMFLCASVPAPSVLNMTPPKSSVTSAPAIEALFEPLNQYATRLTELGKRSPKHSAAKTKAKQLRRWIKRWTRRARTSDPKQLANAIELDIQRRLSNETLRHKVMHTVGLFTQRGISKKIHTLSLMKALLTGLRQQPQTSRPGTTTAI